MSEILTPQPEFDEVLSQYPELARARDLFIDLFRDHFPLVNFGYTNRQIEFARPVLRLLEEEGEVTTHLRSPYLGFDNPRDPWAKALQIYYLPSRQGFHLHAIRDETSRGWSDLTQVQRWLRIVYAENPVVVFDDFPGQVADIALFYEDADIANLDYLVRELYSDSFTNARQGMQRESTVSKIARTVGIAGTYRAAWVDETTKLEFVAKLDTPEDREFGPVYVAHRRLKPIFDSQGTVVPFGKKANVSEQKVTRVLSAQKQQGVTGQLAWDGARIANYSN